MNIDDLRHALRDGNEIGENGFTLLKEICHLRNSGTDDQATQELILRAMEHRLSFGSAIPVLDALVRDAGLFPYLQTENLSLADRLAREAHRPAGFENVVFHHRQAKIFYTIMAGKSVILSAPTSFGKSLIIDAIVATRRFANIVVIVPTLALIDETRRRLSQFRPDYSLLTQTSQKPGMRNIFVMTQERFLDSQNVETVNFFVIDEFYKLSPTGEKDERSALLNQAFYALSKKCKHFYLLGPGIQGLSEEFRHALRFEFFHEPYHTVVSEIHAVKPGRKPLDKLKSVAASVMDSTLVFRSSPDRAKVVAAALPGESPPAPALVAAADWIAEHYHPQWHLVDALRRGIGIHHGRVPRSLAQYVVRAFDEQLLKFLVCTSTLIEGVNTKAKNIIVYDHRINKQPIDLFTFNNIRGRSGRMFRHFVGHVYVFHDPPQQGLPFVNVPVFTQGAAAADGLLVQIDTDDLTEEAGERIKRYQGHSELPFDVIKLNVGVAPDAQIALAEGLAADTLRYSQNLRWSGVPDFKQLRLICELIWTFFGGASLGAGSAKTPGQLAAMLLQLSRRLTMRELVTNQLRYVQNDPDQAVRAVLDFQRLWATFHFPKLLRAIGRIQHTVFSKRALPTGSYEQYASLVDQRQLFLPAGDDYFCRFFRRADGLM